MSKKKTAAGQTSKVVKTAGNAQARSISVARTTAVATPTAYPLGFDSLPGIAAFAVFSFLLFIAPYFFSGFWPSSYEYWSHALFLALTACACALYALEPNSPLPVPNTRIARLLVLFFAWCAISVGGTVYLHDSLLELARIGGMVVCFFLARAFLASPEYSGSRKTTLLLAIIAGGVLVCVPPILDFFATRNPRQFSTFYNPNLFANYCAMAIPLAAGGVLLLRQRARENGNSPQPALIGGLVALLILVLGLFVTSSKGGFLAALCAGVVFCIAVFRAKGERAREALRAQKIPLAIVAVLVLIGGGVLFSQTILPRLSSNIENDHSTMFRIYTWAGTLEMANSRPLMGWGAGSFPSAYTQFAQTGYTRSAHQSWLQIAAESGFPAMLFLLAVCVLAFARGWKSLQGSQWPVAAGSLGALTAFCIHGLTDSGWGLVSIGVLLMGVLALLENGGSEEEAQSPLKERQSSINWPFLLAALPLALGSWLYQGAQGGEDLRTESRELMARGSSNSAIEKAVEATQTDGMSARLQANLAQAQERVGQDATPRFEMMVRLQPTRALNYLDYAQYLIQKNGDKERIRQLFDNAVNLDANDPEIRRVRGNWLLQNGDASGWKDFEHIASLAEKPYGKYPATPEMVDLNFARAYAKLATRDVERKQFASAQKYIASGLEQIKTARQYEPQRRKMEIEVHGAADEERARELDELEAQLQDLSAKVPTQPVKAETP